MLDVRLWARLVVATLVAVGVLSSGSASAATCLRASVTVCPPPPQGVTARGIDHAVVAGWSGVTGAASYQVWFDGARARTVGASTRSATFTGLVDGVDHRVAVTALDSAGRESTLSTVVHATPLPAPPPAPLSPQAQAGVTLISLRWIAPRTGLRYDVLRDGVVVARAITATSWSSTSVTNGRTYTLAVRSVDAFGQRGPLTASRSVTPLAPPPAPTGVSVRVQDGQATFAWPAQTSPLTASVRVYRGATVRATVPVGTRHWADTGLVNGTAYAWSVRSVNDNGTVGATAVPFGGTPSTALQAPPAGFAVRGGDARVDLSWNATPAASQYLLLRDGSVLRTLTGAATGFTDLSVVNGSLHAYRIQVVVSGQVSAASTERLARVLAVPPAPTGLTGRTEDRGAHLAWGDSPAAAVSVDVLRDGVAVTRLPVGSTSYDDTGLVNGHAYGYAVRYVNLNGAASPSSAPVSVTPTPPPAAPAPPSVVPGDGEVRVSWPAVTGASAYTLWRDGVAATTGTATSFADTGLTNGVAVTYALSATVGGRESTRSTDVTVTPAAIPPAVPAALAAAPGDSQVTLTWDLVTGADVYRVYRDGVEVAAVTDPLLTDGALDNGTTYHFAVLAEDSRGVRSALSSTVDATPLATRTDVPTLSATAGHEQVALHWAAGPGAGVAVSWEVRRDGVVVGRPDGALTTWTDLGRPDGATYRYQVAAVYGDGSTSALSAVVAARPRAPWRGVSVGARFACGVHADGVARCWGANDAGQLGDGSTTGSAAGPVLVAGPTGVSQVSAGAAHACAVAGTTAWCWGEPASGRTGHAGSTPAVVPGVGPVLRVAAGWTSTCFLGTDGGVRCIGDDASGQLGDGGGAGGVTPVLVPLGARATDVSVGRSHACAVLEGGGVACWGAGVDGQLGNGARPAVSGPVRVTGVTTATAVAAGADHTCVLLGGGAVECTGGNGSGQLGTGDAAARTTASGAVVTGATAVSAGDRTTCVTLANGQARCAGEDGDGQLGDLGVGTRPTPVGVKNLDTADVVDTGEGPTTCAVTHDGSAWCLGRDDAGQLGVGDTDRATGVSDAVPTLAGVSGVVAGAHASCGVTTVAPQHVVCWGTGPVLAGAPDRPGAVAVPMPGGATVRKVVVAGDTACALTSGYQTLCWGANDWGQAGVADTPVVTTPTVLVLDGLPVTGTDLALGSRAVCVRRSSATLLCAGRSDELGAGIAGPAVPHPVPVPVVDDTGAVLGSVALVALGDDHGCAAQRWDPASATPTGLLFCWGANTNGQLGAGTVGTARVLAATAVPTLAGATSVAAGARHTCVVTQGSSRVVWCFGAGDRGQLGNGGTADRAAPTAVAGITNGSRVFAAASSTCVKSVNAGGWCFGAGDQGQSGSGLLADVPTPTVVYGADGQTLPAVSFVPAGSTTCAQLTDASLRCWGQRTYASFGAPVVGTTVSLPVVD